MKGRWFACSKTLGLGLQITTFGTTFLAIADTGNKNGMYFNSVSGDDSGMESLQIFYSSQVPRNSPVVYSWIIRCRQKGMNMKIIM